MILACPDLDNVIEIGTDAVATLVIENREFFRRFLQDISTQLQGGSGSIVLSNNGKTLDFTKNSELVDSFLFFSLNRKTLLTKITSALERTAVNGEKYAQTAFLMGEIEHYINDLTAEFTCNLLCGKITAGTIIKSAGISIAEDYEEPLEKILDYMELVREFDRDKLFVFVNMRAYFTEDAMESFFETVLSHEYYILLVDAYSCPVLPNENRLTIDDDLCEF